MADTTTTTFSPRLRAAAIFLATSRIRSMLPTDVPPNFLTTKRIWASLLFRLPVGIGARIRPETVVTRPLPPLPLGEGIDVTPAAAASTPFLAAHSATLARAPTHRKSAPHPARPRCRRARSAPAHAHGFSGRSGLDGRATAAPGRPRSSVAGLPASVPPLSHRSPRWLALWLSHPLGDPPHLGPRHAKRRNLCLAGP